MKASWSGYLNLGKLTIPIRLYSATRSVAPKFVQLHRRDHSPISRVTTCETEGKEIKPSEIVRAVQRDGKYIELSESDLRPAQDSDKNITVHQFADPGAIPSIYYDKPYYMVPGKGGELAYTLLREAFVKVNKIAAVTFMLYEKQHIGIISAIDGILMLQQLRFASEIVPRSDIKMPSLPKPTPVQVDLATELMERFSAPFYIEDYRNEQIEHMEEVIGRKVKGLPPKRTPTIAPQTTPEEELMPTLSSLLRNQGGQQLLG